MVVMYLLRADTSPRWKIRCIQHVATRQSMQEGVLPDARAQVSPRPGRPAASVRDTPGVRTAPWSPPAPQPLGLWLLLLLPCCQPESLLCARPAAARHCIPGASPAAGVLGYGAVASTGHVRVPIPFFPGCPIVLVDGFQHVLENESQGFLLIVRNNVVSPTELLSPMCRNVFDSKEKAEKRSAA